MRPNYLQLIKERIDSAAPSSVFVPSDFFDITRASGVNMCLKRLLETGDLYRLSRGIFVKPRYSTVLESIIPPRANDIAQAIARNYGWTVIPFGDTALNTLGLSTQVPAVWNYVSDGPYKVYAIDGRIIKFRHTDLKNELIGLSYKLALVIQAIKAIGKDKITQHEVRLLSMRLSPEEKKTLLLESQRVTAWVYEVIKKICLEDENETTCNLG
jgi:hypothetical protein